MPKLLFVHNDLFVLAGNLRAMLMLADLAKAGGYQVVFLYSDIRPREAWYWSLPELKEYHPLIYLEPADFQQAEYRVMPTRIYDWLNYEPFDLWITDDSQYLFFGHSCPQMYRIFYVHYPNRPRAPATHTYAFNSSFTASLSIRNWGITGFVMWPPIWNEFYRCRDYDDRDYDVVFFGQLYTVKRYDLAEKLAEKGYKVLVMGADVEDWKPSSSLIEVKSNLTLEEYTDLLSRSKVYVHARPGEHFGITIVEAMASCTPTVVHRSGGQWTDVAEYGRWAMGWTGEQELIRNIHILLNNRRVWEDWSLRAKKRAEFFDGENLKDRWNAIIEEAITLRKQRIKKRS